MTIAKLNEIPQILQILVEREIITPEQQAEIVGLSKIPGKFAGELLVEKGYTTKEQVDKGLEFQARKIAEAAHKDALAIQNGETLEVPGWLKPHWGNGGKVNPCIEKPTVTDAAIAAANFAKMAVLLVNSSDHKQDQVLLDKLDTVVVAAEHLTTYLVGSRTIIQSKETAIQFLGIISARFEELGAILKQDPKLVQDYSDFRGSDILQGIVAIHARNIAAEKTER